MSARLVLLAGKSTSSSGVQFFHAGRAWLKATIQPAPMPRAVSASRF
jgi:hypothetical protein